MALSQAQRTIFEKAQRIGAGAQGVALDDAACIALLAILARDLEIDHPLRHDAQPNFYELSPEEVRLPVPDSPIALFEELIEKGPPDVDTYFACLASLQKARLKYRVILATQPVPSIDQVGPRGLLQYGAASPRALLTLLYIRKWFFDIDNRAGQETGYLFEPILAASIGGVPCSAKKSPIRRKGTGAGRQVDCLREDIAYEFKIRVTIAASGQGRWGEELSFPSDATSSGFRPVLIVFDPTPNPKLDALADAFRKVGGRAFIGDEAWQHLKEQAGKAMGHFLEAYVHQPLASLLAEDTNQGPLKMAFELDHSQVRFGFAGEAITLTRSGPDIAELVEEELPEDVDDEVPGI